MTKLEKLKREYDPAPEEQISDLRAERDALAERLRQTPDMREVIAELRKARMSPLGECYARVNDLLYRLDREPPTTGET